MTVDYSKIEKDDNYTIQLKNFIKLIENNIQEHIALLNKGFFLII